MMAFTSETTPKNAIRQIRTMRPVTGRGHLAAWKIISSSCRRAEIVARGCALAGRYIVEMERDRGRSRRHVGIVGDEHAHLARLVRADVDDETAVRTRLHDVDQRSRQTRDAERKL